LTASRRYRPPSRFRGTASSGISRSGLLLPAYSNHHDSTDVLRRSSMRSVAVSSLLVPDSPSWPV
jgi:hypothetical protein